MDATIAIQKFTDYVKTLGIQKKRITDLLYRVNRVSQYVKDPADISDVNFMRSSLQKGQSIVSTAYNKLSSIKHFIDAAKEAVGLGHPFIVMATIATTVLAAVGGLMYTVGKLTDTTNRKLDLIEKKVLPPEALTVKPGLKIDLGPLKWLAFMGIGFLAINFIRRKM